VGRRVSPASTLTGFPKELGWVQPGDQLLLESCDSDGCVLKVVWRGPASPAKRGGRVRWEDPLAPTFTTIHKRNWKDPAK
jgi:hypothetical protein